MEWKDNVLDETFLELCRKTAPEWEDLQTLGNIPMPKRFEPALRKEAAIGREAAARLEAAMASGQQVMLPPRADRKRGAMATVLEFAEPKPQATGSDGGGRKSTAETPLSSGAGMGPGGEVGGRKSTDQATPVPKPGALAAPATTPQPRPPP